MKKRLDENGSKLSRFVGAVVDRPQDFGGAPTLRGEYPGQVQLTRKRRQSTQLSDELSAIRCGPSIAKKLVVIG